MSFLERYFMSVYIFLFFYFWLALGDLSKKKGGFGAFMLVWMDILGSGGKFV